MVRIYNRILLSHQKDEIMPFAASWIDIEMIILREEAKDKYHKILLICGLFRNVTNEFIYKTGNRLTNLESKLIIIRGKEEE